MAQKYNNNEKEKGKKVSTSSGKELKEEYRQQLAIYEKMLINYLVQKKDAMNNIPGGFQRLRSLTFGINTRNPDDPLFTVQIGMFEVSFSIISGAKDRGTLFGLEKYIMDWYRMADISKKLEELAKRIKR